MHVWTSCSTTYGITFTSRTVRDYLECSSTSWIALSSTLESPTVGPSDWTTTRWLRVVDDHQASQVLGDHQGFEVYEGVYEL